MVAEEAAANEDKEMDYLAPFLQQINNPRVLTPQQAFKLKEECLADLKQRLIDKANLIQQRFEKVRCASGAFYAVVCLRVVEGKNILLLRTSLKQNAVFFLFCLISFETASVSIYTNMCL